MQESFLSVALTRALRRFPLSNACISSLQLIRPLPGAGVLSAQKHRRLLSVILTSPQWRQKSCILDQTSKHDSNSQYDGQWHRASPCGKPLGWQQRRAITNSSARVQTDKAQGKGTSSAQYHSPSEELTQVLQYLGHDQAVSQTPSTKADFSRCVPKGSYLGRATSKHAQEPNGRTNCVSSRVTLISIVARYLRNLSAVKESDISRLSRPGIEVALQETFSGPTLAYLHKKGYNVVDVANWAWILTSTNTTEASLRLWMAHYSATSTGNLSKPIPVTILLFLLRRPFINASALRNLLAYSWCLINGKWPSLSNLGDINPQLGRLGAKVRTGHEKRDHISTSSRPDDAISESGAMILFVRLIRHARQTWPESILSITELLSTFLASRYLESLTKTPLGPRTASSLTSLCNRALSLLSLPSSPAPYQSIHVHQKAQFSLIKRMASFNPPLIISQEGYRAVIKVQAAHRKTSSERQWADSKAKSWPPWREYKLGLEKETEPEDGISRAGDAIRRMREAGYASSRWDQIAGLYGGWDTDGSPTIQTRRLVRRTTNDRPTHFDQLDVSDRKARDHEPAEHSSVWAARIESTRTVQEAWACFLAHEDLGLSRTPSIFFAMLEKLVFEEKRQRRESTKSKHAHDTTHDTVHPGDGKEILPAPISPQEATFVRTEPPSSYALFDRMLREEIRPTVHCIAFLVSNASSVDMGLRYLRRSRVLQRDQYAALVGSGKGGYVPDFDRATLHTIPRLIYVAVIRIFCRFSAKGYTAPKSLHSLSTDDCTTASPEVQTISETSNLALAHALRLHLLRPMNYRPPWISLLSAFAAPKAFSIGDHDVSAEAQSWAYIKLLLERMQQQDLELDPTAFHKVCVGLEKALFALKTFDRPSQEEEVQATLNSQKESSQHGIDAHMQVSRSALGLLKNLFDRLVGQRTCPSHDSLDEQESVHATVDLRTVLPPLVSVPGPVQLHAYIRVLGLMRDFDGLLQLLDWMSRYTFELESVLNEAQNGRRMLRRCLIASRVFLERSWEAGHKGNENFEQSGQQCASEDMVERAFSVIEDQENWGGWPSDADVDEYCQRGRFF